MFSLFESVCTYIHTQLQSNVHATMKVRVKREKATKTVLMQSSLDTE